MIPHPTGGDSVLICVIWVIYGRILDSLSLQGHSSLEQRPKPLLEYTTLSQAVVYLLQWANDLYFL